MTDREKLPSGDVERVALAADAMRQLQATNRTWTMEDLARAALSAMPDRQAGINEGLEMAAKVAEQTMREELTGLPLDSGHRSGIRWAGERITDALRAMNALRAMKVEK